MRRFWIALVVILGALFGFGAGFIGTLFIGISQSVDSDCDGVCFSELPTIGLAAYAVGVICAILTGFGVYGLVARRSV